MNSRVLPFSLEAEQAVISSAIEDSSCIDKISFLSPGDFYVNMHREIFEIIKAENDKGNPIDLAIIAPMITDEMGGMAYLADMVKQKSTPRNVVAYANAVLDNSIRRSAIERLSSCVSNMYDHRNNFLLEIAEAEDFVSKQIARKSDNDVLTIDQLVDMSVDEMERSQTSIRSGISTGIPEIDERLGDSYLALGEITVLGALSKNGKTLFANTITARMELLDNEVGHIFSIEMPSAMMFNAIVSARTGVPANFYRKQDWYQNKFPQEYDSWMMRWGAAAQELRESRKFSIDGAKEVDADYICAGMRKQAALAKNAGKVLRYVMIDHLHRMNFHNGTGPMTYAIRDAVRKIKNTASELGIAVLLLAQLNNRAEDKDPTSFHILDSSSVRHELQAFIGTRLFRENGNTYFGVYADSQRFADMDTKTYPAYMLLAGGVLRSLPDNMKNWKPSATSEE